MTATGFFVRVLTPGMLALLALTINTLVVQQAHGATTSTSEECSTELQACAADETCRDCIFTIIDSSSEEFTECRTALGHDEIDSSTVTCSDQMEVACCLDEAAEEECLDNNEFVEYFLCFLATAGCTDDDITCSGAGSNPGGASHVVVAFSCVFAFLLPLSLLWA